MLVAHRGGSGVAPENTLVAFRRALDWWDADMLELDVRATRDGEVVVLHDATVDRTTDGTGAVESMTLVEVRDLDAGYRFRAPDGRTPFRGHGVRVPLLREVVQAFPRTRLNVEIKDRAAAAEAVRVVRRMGASHRTLIAAATESARRPARAFEGPWGASRRQLFPFLLLHRTPLRSLARPCADIFQVPLRWMGIPVPTRAFVREAHRLNVPVQVWTVDEPGEMERLLDLGVDGIQTDRPDRLADILHRRRGRPRPPGPPEGGDRLYAPPTPDEVAGRARRGPRKDGEGGASRERESSRSEET